MATATKKPSGLSIVRDGNKFTCSWKIPSCKYGDGQQFQYRIKVSGTWGSWTSVSCGKTATSKVVTVSASSYYPGSTKVLDAVRFRVRGNRENTKKVTYGWSDWEGLTFDVEKPNKPAVSATLSSSQSNVCSFSWNTTVDGKARQWFTNVEVWSILVKNCTETDGSKLWWSSSAPGWGYWTGQASGNINITEDTATIANGSYTRWVAVRARGPQGASAWSYAKHVYATPNQTTVNKVTGKDNESGGISVNTTWEASQPASNPIDSTTVQYKIAIPAANMACPDTGSWTDANVSKDTGGKDAASFNIDSNLDDDQCLWIRVNTQHDSNIAYGKPALTRKGNLKDPSGLSVSINSQTFRATVTASNNSQVPDSFLAIILRRSKSPGEDLTVGIITGLGEHSATVQCPDWTDDPNISFGVYACVGSYDAKTRADGADSYAVNAIMKSASTIWEGGSVPLAPEDVTVNTTNTDGTIRVTWDWTWSESDTAEISWADHADAWESTDEPSKYEVTNLYASAWNISGLDNGITWYVRVRLKKGETFGPYSDIKSIDLSSAPFKPGLVLSQAVIRKDGLFTAYWDYLSSDSTEQEYAEIREATISSGTVVIGDGIAHTQTARKIDIACPETWETGETYLLCLRVTSSSGRVSEWSDPVAITVAEPVTANITQHSLQNVTIPADVEAGETRTVLSLTEMPLTVTVTGADTGGQTVVILERAADYQIDRPDESEFNGYEGETITQLTQTGEAQITISKDELIGTLDDGAAYRLRAIVQDGLGQTDSKVIDFEVHWSHQAIIPGADETIRGTAMELTPIAPEGTATGDTCDIYRLSADEPVLIAEGIEFGQTYIDPYPAIGDNGGHRFVFRTADGDYITEDNEIAWLDLADKFYVDYAIIDFGGEQLELRYNFNFSNQWGKEFTETKYLGGAVRGDWGPAVSRTTSMAGVMVTAYDDEMIAALRKLAVYTGTCHVRTQDGSSFDADVQVSESRAYSNAGRQVEFSLSITRVDPEGLDALPIAVWEA